jgi:hypothetical protein
MDSDHARLIAERAHAGDGAAVLAHLARVALTTPEDARAIAWLHEALDRGVATEHELLAEGLSNDELRALRLVTPPSWTRSDRVYLAHVELIARATGPSGDLARSVKVADLADWRRHPRVSADGWSPPYAEGLRRLRAAGMSAVTTA